MKKIFLILLLLALILLELWFLEAFLPYGWRHPVSELFELVFPSDPYPPHHVGLEFEIILRNHPFWRIGAYVLTSLLAIANSVLISKVWKAVRKPRTLS